MYNVIAVILLATIQLLLLTTLWFGSYSIERKTRLTIVSTGLTFIIGYLVLGLA